MKTLLTVALAALLFGCASSGPKIEATKLEELRKGKTTAAEIYKQFGRPNFLSKNMDGSQTAVFVHAESGSTTVAPIIGALSAATETVTFYFDPAGVLSDYKYSPPGEVRTSAAPATKSSAPVTPTAATATAAPGTTPPVAKTTPTEAAQPVERTSGSPYLWDILRNSTAKDPRNP